MKIFIVLPAYNEAEDLPPLVKSIGDTFREEGKNYCAVIVNDGSVDSIRAVIERLCGEFEISSIHFEKNQGLAAALLAGLTRAATLAGKGDIIVTMDADNSHPAGLIPRMVNLIREGNDVVIASRYREGSRVIGVSRYRRLLSFGVSWLLRFTFPTSGVRDFTCGFRCYRAEAIQNLIRDRGAKAIEQRGFSCMLELLLRLRESRCVVTEVPLILRYDRKIGLSKMRVMQTIGETLQLIWQRRIGV